MGRICVYKDVVLRKRNTACSSITFINNESNSSVHPCIVPTTLSIQGKTKIPVIMVICDIQIRKVKVLFIPGPGGRADIFRVIEIIRAINLYLMKEFKWPRPGFRCISKHRIFRTPCGKEPLHGGRVKCNRPAPIGCVVCISRSYSISLRKGSNERDVTRCIIHGIIRTCRELNPIFVNMKGSRHHRTITKQCITLST